MHRVRTLKEHTSPSKPSARKEPYDGTSPSKARRFIKRVNGEEVQPPRTPRIAKTRKSLDTTTFPDPLPQGAAEPRTPRRRQSAPWSSDAATPLTPTPTRLTAAALAAFNSPSKEVWMGEDGEDGVSMASLMSIVSESTVRGGARAMSVDTETVRGWDEGGEELPQPMAGHCYVGKPPPGQRATGQFRQTDQSNKNHPVAGSSRDQTPTPTTGRMFVGSRIPILRDEVYKRVRERMEGVVEEGADVVKEVACVRVPRSVVKMHMPWYLEEFTVVEVVEGVTYVRVPKSVVKKHIPWYLE